MPDTPIMIKMFMELRLEDVSATPNKIKLPTIVNIMLSRSPKMDLVGLPPRKAINNDPSRSSCHGSNPLSNS